MAYVLVYTDNHKPKVLQGTLGEINAQIRREWVNGDIDRDDWGDLQPWELFGIEDGRLTPMANVESVMVPQFEVN